MIEEQIPEPPLTLSWAFRDNPTPPGPGAGRVVCLGKAGSGAVPRRAEGLFCRLGRAQCIYKRSGAMMWHLQHPIEIPGWLKGRVHQGVAILWKHDASAGSCSGGGCIAGRLMGGPAKAQTAEEAAEGAAHLSISA